MWVFSGKPEWKPTSRRDGRAWLAAAPGTRLHLASARPHSHFTSCSFCLTNMNQCKFFLSHGNLQTPADVGGTLLGAVSCHHLVTAWSLALTRASQHRHRRLFSLPRPAPKQDLYLKYQRMWDASVSQNTVWEKRA